MSKVKPQRVSQAFIAKHLGVSQSLVSMVLNGRREGISPEAYERIWACARQHGYRPRGMDLGVAMAGEVQPVVGYLLRAPLRLANKSNFFSHVTQGLYDQLRSAGAKLTFLGSELDLDEVTLRREVGAVAAMRGVVVLGEVNPAFLRVLAGQGKPLVYVSARASGLCHSVMSNDQQAASLLVDHLVAAGHRRFGWLGGDLGTQRERDRRQSLADSLRQHGLELPERSVSVTRSGDRMDGYEAMRLLADTTAEMPTALLCVNALVARGAITWLMEHGYRVGVDVSVGTFDATRVCQDEMPGITGAAADPEEMGREAGRLVMGALGSGRLSESILPAQLTVRASTGPVRSGNRAAAARR